MTKDELMKKLYDELFILERQAKEYRVCVMKYDDAIPIYKGLVHALECLDEIERSCSNDDSLASNLAWEAQDEIIEMFEDPE
jgi:hypothetical protein